MRHRNHAMLLSAMIALLAVSIVGMPTFAAQPKQINVQALRLAVEDLQRTYAAKYPGEKFLKQIDDIERALAADEKGGTPELVERFIRLRDEALLANPLLDFEQLLLVRRDAKSPKLGLPQNWQGNCALPRKGYDDQIAVLSPVRPGGKMTTLYKPETSAFVGDVDDADRVHPVPLDPDVFVVFPQRFRVFPQHGFCR